MKISLNKTTQINQFIESSIELERSGEYLKSFQLLRNYWNEEDNTLNLESISPYYKAELFLRFGSLLGYIGDIKGIPSSQNLAKDLLTEARNRFLDLFNYEKVAECENYLSIAYLNINEIEESEIWLNEAYSHELPKTNKTRLYSHIVKSMLLLFKKEYVELTKLFSELKNDFVKSKDNYLLGIFFNNLGLATKNIKISLTPLSMFYKAKEYLQKINHFHYLGSIDNNIAQLFISLNHFKKAHLAVDSAIDTFEKIQNSRRKSVALDTKALIYLMEGETDKAIELNNLCLKILKTSNSHLNIIECLFTKIKIQFSLNKVDDAVLTFTEAASLGRQYSGDDFVRKITKEFTSLYRTKFPYVIKVKSENRKPDKDNSLENVYRNFSVLLPIELSASTKYHAVSVKYDYFEEYGIKAGMHLILDPTATVKRGDFVSLEESESSDANLGFYDEEFGIVCLVRPMNFEPEIFNKEDIFSIKKVVGFGEYDSNIDAIDVKLWNKKNLI